MQDIHKQSKQASLRPLSAEQRAAVSCVGSAFVEAGPGTGKTHVLAARADALLAAGVDPRQILILTFSRRAATELRFRIVGAGIAADVRTFHGFASRLLEASGARFKSRRLLDAFSHSLVVQTAITRAPLDTIVPIVRSSERFHEDAARFAADLARNPAGNVAALRARATPRLHDLITIADEIRQLRERLRASDIDDLVTRAVDALQDPASRQTRWLHARYAHVLVDEFQDVDPVQLDLITCVRATVFAVGDPAQSIYRFRGAKHGIIDEAIERLRMRDFTLTVSQRCPQPICDLAARTPLLGAVALTSAAERTGEIDYRKARTVFDEAALIADDIEDALEAGTKANRIAVLLRTMRPLGPAVVDELRARRIDIAATGPDAFFADPRIGLIRAALAVLARPSDITRWYRLLAIPSLHFDAVRVQLELQQSDATSLESMLAAIERKGLTGRYTCDGFACVLRDSAEAFAAGSLGSAVKRLVNGFDILGDLARRHGGAAATRANIARVRAFVDSLTEAQRSLEGMGRAASCDDVLAAADADPRVFGADSVPEDDVPGVRVLTIHGAKGLEFDFVIIGDAIEGRFPSGERRSTLLEDADLTVLRETGVDIVQAREDAALLDEAALWYVAVTRTRERLLVTFATQGADGSPQRVSRFVPKENVPPENAEPFERELGRMEYAALRRDERTRAAVLEAVADSPIITAVANEGILTFAPLPARAIVADARSGVSAVEKWFKCPRLFFYERIVQLTRESSEHAQLGTLIHAILATFHTELTDFKSVPSDAAERWVTRLTTLREDAFKEVDFSSSAMRAATMATADRMLRSYVTALIGEAKKTPFVVLATEYDVKIQLKTGTMRGRVDRIDRLADGTLALRDYKTGRFHRALESFLKGTKKDAYNDGESLAGRAKAYFNPQLALYRRGVEEAFSAKVSRLDYLFLKGDDKAATVVKIDQTKLDDDTIAIIELVENDVDENLFTALAEQRLETFAQVEDPGTCERCEYGGLCPGFERL